MSGTPSHSVAERAALADALQAAGPDAPTLCEGWTARDLAAHLVIRERRPDASAGIVLPPLARWSARVRMQYAARPFAELVQLVRTGPPPTSAFAIPGVDARLNLVEHFVHCEDVRRGREGWQPRPLPSERSRALWRVMARGRFFYRNSPVGVVLLTPDGERQVAIDREPAVQLTGEPGEHLLYAMGRGTHARLDVTGPPDAVQLFGELRLRA